jgi:predicted Fe-Mo cluster-binding NifX family protein
VKIAAVTDDGKTISMHFGRAEYYLVCTVEDGKITGSELRDKVGHRQFASEPHHDHDHHQHDSRGHGFGQASGDRHSQMIEAITDCEALLTRGMGRGAYVSLEAANIKPIVTDIASIESAVLAYASGDIVNHIDKLH